MNIRIIGLTAAAFAATFAVSATATTPTHASAEPAPRADRALHAEIMASMRELLIAVTPEIALPTVEIALPPLGGGSR